MNSKRNALVKVLLAVLLAICSLGIFACKKEDSTPTNYGETGIYSFYAIDEEYQLTLNDGRYTLTIEGANLEGKYAYDGVVLSLYGEDSNIIGSIDGTILTITYNGGTYSFYKQINYMVKFDVDGGSAIESVTVVNGKTLSKPADPVKEGYQFIGWYADEALTKAFAFDSDIITSDTTLYARFIQASASSDEYSATLYVDGEVLDIATTLNGVLYGLPTPVNGTKTFAGWWISDYQSADKLTCKYDGQTLAQDVNLYAVWAEDGLQVSVNATTISWSAIRTGVEYTVTIKGVNGNIAAPKTTTDLSIAFDFAAEDAGEYTVTVSAEGQTVTAYYKNKALDRVSKFSVTDSTLVYNAVANAEKYVLTISCGNADHTHVDYDNGASTNYNFANCDMKVGGIEFIVTAMANGYVSSEAKFVYNLVLDAVTGVSFDIETGELTWTAVENATAYNVEVTAGGATTKYTVTDAKLSLTKYTGELSVKIAAVNVKYNSPAATEFACTISKLPAPVISYVNDKVVWTAIAGATGYIVKVNDTEYTVSSAEFALPEECQVAGASYIITVKAAAEDSTKNSYYSESIKVDYATIGELTYDKNYLRWGAVGGAYSYRVLLNGAEVATLASDARKAAITFKKQGNNTITLEAYGQSGNLIDSKEVKNVLSYMVSFNSNGGSPVSPIYKAAGDTVELPESTKQYYMLAGWYTALNGPEGNGAQFSEDDVITGPTTLYAYWAPAEFEVVLKVGKYVFDADGNPEYVYDTYTDIVCYNSDFVLPIPETDDVTKIFNGWYEDDDEDSTRYTNGAGESLFKWPKTGGHTLYAGWVDIVNFTLIENKDGYSWQVSKGEATERATEITIPGYYVDPLSKNVYPVTHIAAGAFLECNLLQTLNLPDTLQSIFLAFGSTTSGASTGSALYRCTGLKNINVYCVDEDGVHDENSRHETYYSSVDGMLLRHASPNTETLEYGVELAFVPFNRGSGTLVVPDGVEHIPTRTFYSLQHKKIVIPATVQRIGERAFYGCACTELVFEEAPAGVDERPLELTEGVLFTLNCEEITIPTRVGDLDFNESNMFTNNKYLQKIHVKGRPTPDQKATNSYYTSVDGLVCDYTGEKLVFVPKYISGVVTIPTEIKVIGENAFLNCFWNLDGVIIKDNVRKIESNAFLNCNTMKTVEFDYHGGSLEIESRAFYGCTSIYAVELPAQLQYLGSFAFGNTPKLQTVTINGDSNAVLEEFAFSEEGGKNKGYITTLNLGSNAPAFEINKVFGGCQLYVLNIDDNNTNFTVDKGVLYDDAMTTILYYPFGLTTNYTVPDTVTVIGESVFENRANITSIVIPASVTEIRANAFKNCVGLETLTFAPRTTDLTIESGAFANCIALTEVAFPEGMTMVEDRAFENCINLTTIHLSSTIESFVLTDAFYGCKKIQSVTVAQGNENFGLEDGILYEKSGSELVYMLFVPDSLTGEVVIPTSVTLIEAGMFRGKTGITSISFENDETTDELVLGESVFEGMTSLTDVRLPDGLLVIPSNAFKGSSITSVYIPNTVEQIMPGAFADCKKLTTVTFQEGTTKLAFKNASSKTGAFYNTPKLTSITLPNRLKVIGDYMFANSSLETIVFPSALETIGEGAFVNSKKITSIVMPNTVTTVKSFAFSGCTALESVTLSSALTTIPEYLFAQAAAGTSPNASNSGSSSGGGSIKKNPQAPQTKAKDDVLVDNSITTGLREDVVAATALKSIVIPASVSVISKYAFHGCSSLATVTFESNENLTMIGAYAFMESGLVTFDMPDSVTSIGAYMFVGCTKLETLELSRSATSIPEGLCDRQYVYEKLHEFDGSVSQVIVESVACSSLKSITIPANIKTIGAYAFRNTTALETLTFENGSELTSIGDSAFQNSAITTLDLTVLSEATTKLSLGAWAFTGCALEEVHLPVCVKDLGSAFLGCNNIQIFTIVDTDEFTDNNFYNVDAESLVVYNSDINEIRLYVGHATEFVVPDGVTKIHKNAFRGNTSLQSISFPTSLVEIREAAFALCTNLKTVTFRDVSSSRLTTIAYRAFAFSGVENITIPATVYDMGGRKEYTLGEPVNVNEEDYLLGSRVMDGWNVNNSSGLSDWSGRVFEECTSLKSVNLLTTTLCKSMFSRCTSLEAVQFAPNTSRLHGYTFEYCTSLKNITIPGSIGMYGDYDFYNSGLTSISLHYINFKPSEYTQTEGRYMFADCENLTEVTLDDRITLIPAGMFRNTGITSFTLPANIQVIEDSAFSACDNLTEVIFPEQLAGTLVIQNSVFSYCPNLAGGMDLSNENITFSWTDYYYGEQLAADVFHACTSLEWVKLSDNVTHLGNHFFGGCTNLRWVEINNLKTMGFNVFTDCQKLESVTLADDATIIGYGAFAGCSSLKNFVIPDSVVEIGEQAFEYAGIETITIGTGVTYIPTFAFRGSTLTEVTIPATVTMIEPSAFLGCENLMRFTVESGNKDYTAGAYGELYNSTNVLIAFPAGSTGDDGHFDMPDNKILGEYAFYKSKLTSVSVSSATSVIPTGAFADSKIATVELTNNVTRIGAYAFMNCVNLVEMELPSTITDPVEVPDNVDWVVFWREYHEYDENAGIGESAFEGCTSLTTINIPKYMTRLAGYTFKGCISLTTIEIPYGMEIIGAEAFAETGLVEIVIPETVIRLGTVFEAEGGKDGGRRGEFGASYGSVFANCTSLKSVKFEGVVEEVLFDMFLGCTSLETVELPAGWTAIVSGMFSGCTSLDIELPATIETIGEEAFAGWTAEQKIYINITIEMANLLWGEGWNGEATVVENEGR